MTAASPTCSSREGRPRQLRLRPADGHGQDRSDELPLSSARVRRPRRQPIRISAASTLHNIHAPCRANSEFSGNGQPIQGMKMTHTFTAKEVMVPFKCDVTLDERLRRRADHPYFAATGDSSFDLKGLPPGTYTIEALAREAGPMTQSVTIAEGQQGVNFAFNSGRRRTDTNFKLQDSDCRYRK